MGKVSVYLVPAALLLALVALAVTAAPAWACGGGVLCVDGDASGSTHDGLSWTTAYTNVQDALAVALPGNEIWVAEGVYYPDEGAGQADNVRTSTFTLTNGVALYGGFAGYGISETQRTQRDWTAYLTVLSGDVDGNDVTDAHGVVTTTSAINGNNAYQVVTGGGVTETARLDGFIITAGYADSYPDGYHGGGMYNYYSGPTVVNLTFSGNRAGRGGGMYNYESDSMLTNITFDSNQAVEGGGGMYNYAGSLRLTNITLSGNQSSWAGGGMINDWSNPVLINVMFSGNRASDDGGGMYNWYSNPTLTNATLSGNQAGSDGGGISNSSGSLTLANSILWGNAAVSSGPQLYNAGSMISVTYSDVQWPSGIYTGMGNLNVDPQFVAPITATAAPTTTGNYRLRAGSSAIDAGHNLSVTVSTDLDGQPRIVGGTVDLGAYEAHSAWTLTKAVTPTQSVAYHGPVTYTLILGNSGAYTGTALLTDTLPAEVAFAAWVISPTNTLRAGNAITWTGALTAGQALTFTFVATHSGGYGDVVTNTAHVSSALQSGSAAAPFTVEPNYAPMLTIIGAQTIDELVTLTFTATATDANINDHLTFTLDAGSVGSITPDGMYSWMPTEVNGPGGYTATVRVSDGDLSDAETISITVLEVNHHAPVLNAIGAKRVDELTALTFTATATDDDLSQVLTYTLDAGAPAGASIAPAMGAFTWTPTEMQGPGVYSLTIRVSDGPLTGSGQVLSDCETISITVAEVNRPPALWPIGNKTVDALTPFHFTARVTDPDWPLNPLTYTLDAGSVGNIGTRTGLFTWTPGAAPETYTATVRVSDGEFEDAASFTLTVNADTPGTGHWLLVANASTGPTGDPPPFSVSNYRLVDTADNAVYGPFLDGQLGSVYGARLDVAVTPDGQTALISNFGDRAVFLVDIANPIQPSLITSVTLPLFAEDIDISADGQYALVTDGSFSPLVASIDIPSATLVYTANLGNHYAQAVEVAPDGTVIVADYFGGVIHTLLLGETGAITTGNTYTYTYPGYAITDTAGLPGPVNLGLSPDGQTLIVCDATTSTVGIYQVVAPGVLTFTGVVTGLHGTYEFYSDSWGMASPGVQSVAFDPAGDKAYAVINNMRTTDITGTNTGDRLGVLDITGPGQVSLAAGGVVTVPHYTNSQLFGVDVVAVAGNQVYVSNPNLSGAADPTSGETSVAVVSLTDYGVTTTMVFTDGVSIPAGVAALPLRLDLHQTVSDAAPVPGQLVTYTLTLVNAGPQINGITLRDELPPEVDFVGPVTLSPPEAGTVGSAPPDLVTNLVISAYQHVTVTVPVRVRAVPPGTVVTNAVQAQSPKLDTAARAERTFTVAPHLALHKAVSDLTPSLYQVITYTLTLSNTGVADDPAVVLTDTLPGQAVFKAWGTRPAGATVEEDEIAWTGPLGGGAVLTFTFSVTQTGSYNEVVANTAEIRGLGQTVSATVTYTVTSNVAPVADAGADQRANPGAVVTLDGSGSSDPYGDPLAYNWTQTGGEPVSLMPSATVSVTTFTAPPQVGVLTFTLTVTDTGGLSASATTVVSIVPYRIYLPLVSRD